MSAPGTALFVALALSLSFAPPARADGPAPAAGSDNAVDTSAFVAKKDTYLLAKVNAITAAADAKRKLQKSLDRRVGAEPAPIIVVYNMWTREYLAVDARGEVTLPPNATNDFLRCRFTDDRADMDPRLLQLVVNAARHFRANRVNVISAFRSPKYNLLLQKKGRNVSRHSQHMLGHAIDFNIPGVSRRSLYKWVRRQRLGGVGFYTQSHFVHADVGPVRTWRAR